MTRSTPESAPSAAEGTREVTKHTFPKTRATANKSISLPAHAPSEDIPAKGVSYQDLFPTSAGVVKSQNTSSDQNATIGSAWSSYDPESDGYSFEHKSRNIARLEGFAREFSQYISVPAAVKKIETSGKAFLRFTRKNEGWRVVSVTGDPYFRALLYEAASGLSPASHALQLLAESTYDTVRIYLSFSTAPSLDLTVKPLVTKTEANKVYIDIVYQESSAAWQIAMPEVDEKGQVSMGINVIGFAKTAYEAVADEDTSKDPEAKRLRLSPAFMRPIGRR